MSKVELRNISKKFGDTVALENIDFAIEEGSFFTFLGPSGCGKTTLLRIISGFVKDHKGRVIIGNKDMTHVSSEKREIGMVFQNYALFPHMNVYENIAYSLKIKKINKKEILNRVDKYLNLVSLDGYGNRKINELSGGEQQRVALGRSLVMEPKVLLLDEPLSNLDARLRDKMRIEIGDLQKELGITTLFVTHDQREALTMSDKIAVFNKGKCIQIGKPREIYSNPKSPFVATFVGENNLFKAKIENSKAILNNNVILEIENDSVGNYISIRPEDMKILRRKEKEANTFKGKVEKIQFNGMVLDYVVNVEGIKFKVSELNNPYTDIQIGVGDYVFIVIHKNVIKILKDN
ncbi:MAG: ABC transporter ATP-binding protein [Anaeromicrobium sp.]|jgi:spermidine/putrescine ABC transporter ATP-binding subunit|uniref:ABC transporter ATP-binding protein n=1 Tax=Anaeromicrobium sp. TaxID=1929132 RepID=UPI0025DBC3AD|nr:ABC transporter ATP-binding protein [Anaeromicrobium sp.]MCT4595327.1 ABC transporter ATP-binding protein [Anaeromicrobium sp.]